MPGINSKSENSVLGDLINSRRKVEKFYSIISGLSDHCGPNQEDSRIDLS